MVEGRRRGITYSSIALASSLLPSTHYARGSGLRYERKRFIVKRILMWYMTSGDTDRLEKELKRTSELIFMQRYTKFNKEDTEFR